MRDIFLAVSILIGFVTPVIGVWSILKGKFRPHRMTRFVLVIITALFFTSLLAQNDTTAVYIAFVQFTACLILFLLSLKYGLGGTTRLDFVVLFGAIVTIIIWKTTSNPELALYMSILTDFIGFSPTLVKSWKKPYTEEWKFYCNEVFAMIFNILAMTEFSFAAIVLPLYLLSINIVTTSIILLRRRNLKM